MRKKLLLISSLVFLGVFCFSNFLFAEKIAIVYTGGSYASLYPCRCPKAPNGGVARRATKIKQLRREYSNLLVLDSGNYFASGIQDINKQTPELNRIRTEVNLSAMETMGYDAIGIGKEEFNFGKEFLLDIIKRTDINFLSCNIDLPGVKPYIIKKFGKTKVGIIGISPLGLNIEPDIKTEEDLSAVIKVIKANIRKLRKKKVNIVILLSHLGRQRDEQLVAKIDGIDIIISAQAGTRHKTDNKIGSVIYLKPYSWAKKLGFLEIDIEKGEIKNVAEKMFPMSKDITDDPDIKAFLPLCFQDKECRKPGFIGRCKSPGKSEATCVYEEQAKVSLLIITPKACKTCKTDDSLVRIKRFVPSVQVSYLNSNDREAKKLIKKFDIKMLPAFLLGEEIAKHNSYKILFRGGIVEKKDSYYLVNPSFVGVSYFLNRKRLKNRLDLFISLRDRLAKNVLNKTKKILDNSKGKIDFHLNFLAMERPKRGGFVAPYGDIEIEEDKISLCVIKKYPQKMWDYLYCHIDKLENGLFDNCVTPLGMDAEAIEQCTISDGDDLLKENIKLSEELEISYGPLFLLENQEIFGIKKDTTVEELENIINK